MNIRSIKNLDAAKKLQNLLNLFVWVGYDINYELLSMEGHILIIKNKNNKIY